MQCLRPGTEPILRLTVPLIIAGDQIMARAIFLAIFAIVLTVPHVLADIYRSDNLQLIPGTEGITPRPGVRLDHRELAFAALSGSDLTGARFDFSNLTNAHLQFSTLTRANLTGASLVAANLTNSSLDSSRLI